jgi:Anaphase-promoting complex APC subunit CDC26
LYTRLGASSAAINMLRRKPTSITLTTEDVAIYEDSRARENHLREQAALQAQMQAQGMLQNKNQNIRDPNDELRPLPGDRARAQHVKTRDERLGLMGSGGGSSRA